MQLFKVREKSTGLFSDGSSWSPSFNKKGKTWRAKHAAINHLGVFRERRDGHLPTLDILNPYEIVEYSLVESNTTSAKQEYKAFLVRRETRKVDEAVSSKKAKINRLKQELNKLENG